MDDNNELALLRLKLKMAEPQGGLQTEETYPAIDPNEQHVDLAPHDIMGAIEDLKQRKLQMGGGQEMAPLPMQSKRVNRAPAVETYSASEPDSGEAAEMTPEEIAELYRKNAGALPPSAAPQDMSSQEQLALRLKALMPSTEAPGVAQPGRPYSIEVLEDPRRFPDGLRRLSIRQQYK